MKIAKLNVGKNRVVAVADGHGVRELTEAGWTLLGALEGAHTERIGPFGMSASSMAFILVKDDKTALGKMRKALDEATAECKLVRQRADKNQTAANTLVRIKQIVDGKNPDALASIKTLL